jgi:hypothetical protein
MQERRQPALSQLLTTPVRSSSRVFRRRNTCCGGNKIRRRSPEMRSKMSSCGCHNYRFLQHLNISTRSSSHPTIGRQISLSTIFPGDHWTQPWSNPRCVCRGRVPNQWNSNHCMHGQPHAGDLNMARYVSDQGKIIELLTRMILRREWKTIFWVIAV